MTAGSPAPSNATSPAPASSGPPFNDERLVFTTTVFLLACFALFAVLSWPRLVTRFSRASEWTRGHFIYHSTKSKRQLPSLKRRPTISSPLEARNEKWRAPNSDDDHTTFSQVGLVRRQEARDIKFSFPPHCRSWSGIYQKPSAILGIQVSEGYSLGRCILLLSYTTVVLYTALYKCNPFQKYPRAGFVAAAQIPIVFALATKNNIIGRFLSMGYEKVKAAPLLRVFSVPSNFCIAFTPAQLPPPVRRDARHFGC
jgi:ferric-chelate reductase